MASHKKLKYFVFFLTLVLFQVTSFRDLQSEELSAQLEYSHVASAEQKIFLLSKEVSRALKKADMQMLEEISSKLVSELKNNSFNNAPDISFSILGYLKSKDLTEDQRRLLLVAAQKISPTHPEVLLSISSYIRDIGVSHSLTNIVESMRYISEYPSFFISCIAKGILLAIICILSALLYTLLGTLVCSNPEVVSYIGSYFRKERRYAFSFYVYILCFMSPLLMELPYVVLLWAVLCAAACPHMKVYPFIAGVFVFFLSFASEPIHTVQIFSDSSIPKLIDNRRMNNYIENGRQSIFELAQATKENALLYLMAAQEEFLAGNPQSSQEYYVKASHTLGMDTGLAYVVDFNVAYLSFMQGNTRDAYTKWKKLYDLGWREYELLYNLSIVTTALYDKIAFDYYYKELRAYFPKQFISFENEISPLSARIPTKTLIAHYVSPSYISSYSYYKMDKAFFIFSFTTLHTRLLSCASVLCLCMGVFFIRKNRRFLRYRDSIVLDRDQLRMQQNSRVCHMPFFRFFYSHNETIFLFISIISLFIISCAYAVPFFVPFAVNELWYVVFFTFLFLFLTQVCFKNSKRRLTL